jgi:hypothetical protein
MIFTTKNMNGKWDDSLNGMQTGTFIWIVNGNTVDGRVIEKNGTLILIR